MRNYIRYVLLPIVFIGYFPVFSASFEGFFQAIQKDDAASVQEFLNQGHDPNTRSERNQHPLVLAIQSGSRNVAKILLSVPGTQFDIRNKDDETPLMLAALKGFDDLCKELVERDADVNKTGWTPLHYAATGGHQAIVQFLLENHAYIDAESPNGSTPLMMAAQYGNAEVVKVLLESGADVSLKNSLGLDALDFARLGKHEDSEVQIKKALKAHNSNNPW